jgi:hypothetical protein
MATNLPTSLTYILPTGIAEPARRCADELINLARMPLYLRRAAATHFGWPS